ncbi:GAF domain-containing protein [Halovenus sp. HT40]|uniref:GAF domain-containing protein n=1 Tax=Halovenus sp. HT40 TaxID=3126691 RepID=UPI00300F4D81
MSHRILCVDPDEESRAETVAYLRSELSALDPMIETADGVATATEQLTTGTAAVITEYELTDGTGFEVIERARDRCPDAGVVLYTETDPDSIDSAELQGEITEYVGKGSVFGTERLAELLRTTIEDSTQRSYPLPQTEEQRLVALRSYDLDDPALLESLDRITDLAAQHFDVDQSSINIISEHSQDFLACYGKAEQWESMDRSDSICTFTILEDENVMTVSDVTEDPRFESRSETLIEMGIRSYMGANLVAPSGLVIGPLCVYDSEPRSFSPADEAYLQKLAATAMDLIELYTQLDATEGSR